MAGQRRFDGGLAVSRSPARWVACRPGFFVPVRVLRLVGPLDARRDRPAWRRALAERRRTDWVVYAKRPFAGPQQVLDYVGRYTHRVAIANHRLLALDGGHIRFTYTDYRANAPDSSKTLTLTATEFIRRFLLHVLPTGFHRIRYYGFLGARHRRAKLAHCRQLLGSTAALPSRPGLMGQPRTTIAIASRR